MFEIKKDKYMMYLLKYRKTK